MSTANTALDWMDATETARRVASGESTERAILIAAADRIRALDPVLNFMVDGPYTNVDDAARSGPLQGVPYLIKDLGGRWPGFKSTFGSALLSDHTTESSDLCTQRAVAAGAVPIGMTSTPELGWGFNTDTLVRGACLNPWNTEYVAGGSSGGAAAAVASRAVPLAHATDGGGSIRVPAAWNGLVGLKPSRGRIPQGPESADGLYGFITDGCHSITVRDTAVFLDAVSGNLPGDIYTPNVPTTGFTVALAEQVRPLRIGVATDAPSGIDVWDEACEAVDRAAAMCRELGHDVRRTRYDYDFNTLYFRSVKRLSAVSQALSVREMESLVGRAAHTGELSAFIEDSLRVASRTSAQDHADDIAQIRLFSRIIAGQMSQFDVVITPVSTCPTPKIGDIQMFGDMYDFDAYHEQIARIGNFTFPMNCSGQPAVSLPLHTSSSGLPVGVQFAGRYGDERTLLQLARQLEQLTPWHSTLPEHSIAH